MDRVEEFDVCVVGGGVMGSCAARSLVEAGKSTVLLEQPEDEEIPRKFPLPHTRGSSSGHSRITSLSDYCVPYMEKIVAHGYKEWMKINATAATTAVRKAPVLTVSTDHEGIKGKAARIEKAGVPPKWVDIDILNDSYKTQFPKDRFAVIDPSGLVLVANKCVLAVQKLFQNQGGVILDGWPVKHIEVEGNRVRVICPRGVVQCQSLVLCPGPWASDVLTPLGIRLPLRTLKTGVWYYKLKNQNIPRTNFNDLSIDKEFFYSTPCIEYPGMIKFGIHDGIEINPEDREKVNLDRLKEKMSKYLQEFFPDLEHEPSIEEACMYTMTPDEDFILDYHPEHKNIVYACGFSGRGFQLAPAVGEILRGMVMGLEDIHDLTPFRSSRFESATKIIGSKI